MYFFDTNIFLEHLDVVEKQESFFLSSVTIQELEEIKVNKNKTEELRYKARRAVRFLEENEGRYTVSVYTSNLSIPDSATALENNHDNQIMLCAYHEYCHDSSIIFVTNDILCRLIAEHIFKLPVERVDSNEDNIYKGYQLYHGTTDQINQLMSLSDESNDWVPNEYLIIENTDDNSVKEMRYDGEKFVSLKLPPSRYIKAKNSLQRCALDALMNQDITVVGVLGGYGSGKSFICLQMALYAIREKGNQSKMLGIREPWGEGKEVGFLAGSFEEKTDLFFQPLVQQLNGGEYELASLKQSGILEFNIPYYLKGTTYQDTIMVCDEAEDLDEKQLRLVGTRLGENSRIFFSGDYKQSLLTKKVDNPLVKMCNEFKGNKHFACVYLGEDVRSETSKMFADLFEK